MRRVSLTVLMLSTLFAVVLLATSTGNVFVTSGTNVDRAGLTAWATPENIVSDNTTDATNNGSGGSDYLVGAGLGFSVDGAAEIKGVVCRYEASEHAGGTEAMFAQLQDDTGALIGSSISPSNEGNVSGTSKLIYTHGSTSNLWGATLTPAIVNDADFGCRVWFVTSHTVNIDFMTVAVEYSTSCPVCAGVNSLIRGGGSEMPPRRQVRRGR